MPGLNRKDIAKLSNVLEAVPAPVAVLRKPILSVAGQDQDLLG